MSAPATDNRSYYRVVYHAILMLTVGLIAGVMLVFSLLGAVNFWPFPIWHVDIPGSTRGWQAAHVGGILNAVMLIALATVMLKLRLFQQRLTQVSWGLIAMGWGNTVFYWAGNVSSNRGLSMADTHFGATDVAGMLAFLGGGAAMFIAFILMYVFAGAALNLSRQS
ncbi:MAG: hypothetical protein AAF542_01455 [Pseudomonadota bacterium]